MHSTAHPVPQPAPSSGHNAAAGAPHPLLPGVATGFGTAVAMWTLWWITHLPAWGQAAPPWHISLPLLGLTLLAGGLLGALAAPRPILTGTIAGLTTALLSLIVLGAVLSDTQGDTASAEAARLLRRDAPAIFAGFMIASGLTGAVGGAAARFLRTAGVTRAAPPPSSLPGPRDWLARLAVVAAVSFVPLIAIGGAVTSTASGMAVADPVVSFVMPLSLMADPRVFIEHTHRLVGTLVGLTAIALFLATLFIDRRKPALLMTGGLLALVTAQGMLGIFRVGENSAPLAMLHGMFAQLVFAVGIATAVTLQPAFRGTNTPPSTDSARTDTDAHAMTTNERAQRIGRVAAALGIAFYALQLATGAASRHLGSVHATYTHAVFAVVVASTVGVAGAALASLDRGSAPGRRLVRIGKGLVAAVVIQFMLGVVTLLAVGGGQRREIPTEDQLATAEAIEGGRALIATAHQTTGALLLAMLVLAAMWSSRPGHLATRPTSAPATT